MLRSLRTALEDFRAALGSETAVKPVAPVDGANTPVDEPTDVSTLPTTADEPPAAGGSDAAPPMVPADEVAPAAPAARRFRRPGLAGAIGAMAAAIALAVYSWAPWTPPEPADPEVVATYQGGAVTREQLKQRFQALPKPEQPLYRSVDGLQVLVGDAVAHEATRRWAEEKQVDQRQAFKEAMKHATEEIQISDVADQMHQGRIQVDQGELQAYYDQNRARYGERPLVEVREQVRQALVEQKEQQFVESYLKDLRERASLQVDYGLLEVPEPTEAEMTAYYEANRERFRVLEQVRVAQVQVSVSLAGGDDKARTRAEGLRARVAAGEELAQVSAEASDGPEKTNGGEVASWVARGGRGTAFDAAVFPLPVGELSPVFKEGDSYYVVRLLERAAERLRPYEEARAEVAQALRREREQQLNAERKDRTLFTIHSRRWTLGEFLQEIEELAPEVRAQASDPAGKRRLLDALIQRLLVVEDAAESAVEVKRQEDVAHARSDLLARLLHQEQVDEAARVSDEEVRAAYDRDPARYAEPPRVKVRYVRVTRGRTADQDEKAWQKITEAEAKLRPTGPFGLIGPPGADFAEVAKAYSEDPQSAERGGDLDRWFGESADPLGETFEHALHEELLPLRVGETTPVLALGDSYYLFQVRERQDARPRSFEEARDLVRRDVEGRKHEELTRGMQQQLFDRAQLRVYPNRLERVLAELGGPAQAGR